MHIPPVYYQCIDSCMLWYYDQVMSYETLDELCMINMNDMSGVTVMLTQGVLPMAACPWQVKPFMSFHVLMFYFCISRKYDVSKKSCIGLPDMKYLKMYYRGYDWLSTSPYQRLYTVSRCCYSLTSLHNVSFKISLSKIFLCPRFLKPSS